MEKQRSLIRESRSKESAKESLLYNVFNYDISMMKVQDKTVEGPSTRSSADDFVGKSHSQSPPRCQNVYEMTELHFKKRKAADELLKSKNRTPFLFDVFNYETTMMKNRDQSEKENRAPLTNDILVENNENHNLKQFVEKNSDCPSGSSNRAVNSSKKRSPLSILNGNVLHDVSKKNIGTKKPRVQGLRESKKSELRDNVQSPHVHHSTFPEHGKTKFTAASPENTPRSILCDILNSSAGSSTSVQGTVNKKCFESTPQTLNFDMGSSNQENAHTMDEAEFSRTEEHVDDPSEIYEHDDFLDGTETWSKDRLGKTSKVPSGYSTLGPPNVKCTKCDAMMWREERTNKNITKGTPHFSLCCANGEIRLPKEKPTPSYLWQLYNDKQKGPKFKDGIRIYNSMFAFTSTGGRVDHSINCGGAPYIYRLNGQNHHMFGSLIPDDGDDPKFCQLYIYDTTNEVANRMKWISVSDGQVIHAEIVEGLIRMLDETNELVKEFRSHRDRFEEDNVADLEITLKVSRAESGRENHIIPADDVAGIMAGDLDDNSQYRDIILHSKEDRLQRVTDIHPKIMALQYPLLFPHGDDGFHIHLPYGGGDNKKKRKRVLLTQKEYYSYKLQVRLNEGMTPRLGGRLFQQYIVDAFSTIEQARLWYIRTHQTKLRNDLYKQIYDSLRSGNTDASAVGKGIVLPAGFIGSRRYMQQNFQDALAVCRYIGHPDIFLTMTTNPLWDEITEMMKLLPHCLPQNSPDIIARVFKLKLDQLVDDIKNKSFFGTCIGVMYVVEFQKRGLPHVHMLIWLSADAKKNLQSNVDKFVSAEVPDPDEDPAGYAAVQSFMIHGPCGSENPKSPCMKDFKCIRHFPKNLPTTTIFALCQGIMTFSWFSALSDLNESRYDWTIRVRAQAIWQGMNAQTKVFRGLNIIFIDDANHRIHAFIAATLCDKFKTDLVEGGIYEISNFSVKVYNGDETYRAIRTPKHIYFNNDTICTKKTEDGLNIQPISLDLYCLHDLESFKNDNRFLIDIVGVIVGKPTRSEYKTDGVDRSNVKFTLTDGSSYVGVTFFNEFGESLLKALEQKLKDPVIIIIASAKIGKWNEEVNLTNYPATRFYLNCTHYSVSTIRRSLDDSTFYLTADIEEIENEVPNLTVKELRGVKADYIQKIVSVKMTVKKIDKTMSWYCNYCITCDVDLKLENNRFKCPKCGKMKPYPDRRYEFSMLCSDGTGTIPIMWTDDELTRYTGKTVYDILGDESQVGDGDKFPPILQQFEKKCYTFTVRVSKENVLEGSNVYTAEKVSNPEEISATHDPEGNISLANKPPEILEEKALDKTNTPPHDKISLPIKPTEISQTPMVETDTPPTGQSSNKARARKVTAVVGYDVPQKSPKPKLKNPKLEKM